MGNTKAHLRPQKNTHDAYQYKRKLNCNLKGRNNARTVKSSTVVIFEDTKCRVLSLIKRLKTMTLQCNIVSHWLGTYTKWSLIAGFDIFLYPSRANEKFWYIEPCVGYQLHFHKILTDIIITRLHCTWWNIQNGKTQICSYPRTF